MIELGWSRRFVNDQVGRIRRMFRWAASKEILPAEISQALGTVDGLRKGRSPAREKPAIPPVEDDVVDATIPFMPDVVAAMVQVQRLTGCRPQEIVSIRAADVDMTDPAVWSYEPGRHKTEHHEKDRVVFIGPKAQAILRGHMAGLPTEPIFSPRRSEAERRRADRKTKLWDSHVAHQERNAEGVPDAGARGVLLGRLLPPSDPAGVRPRLPLPRPRRCQGRRHDRRPEADV
jgi:integrase